MTRYINNKISKKIYIMEIILNYFKQSKKLDYYPITYKVFAAWKDRSIYNSVEFNKLLEEIQNIYKERTDLQDVNKAMIGIIINIDNPQCKKLFEFFKEKLQLDFKTEEFINAATKGKNMK